MITLETPLSSLPRVRDTDTTKLQKIGLLNVTDLLFHFPNRYVDFSSITPINELTDEQETTVIGTITHIKIIRTRRGMTITECFISDETDSVHILWFNQPFIVNNLIEGKTIRVSGKVTLNKGTLHFTNPATENINRIPTNTGRLVPIYSETKGLTSKWLRWQLALLFEKGVQIPDIIPEKILKSLNLPCRAKALKYMHFPHSQNAAILAQKYFAFEEILLIQIKALEVKNTWEKLQSVKITPDNEEIEQFIQTLPFTLTNAQKKAFKEITDDCAKKRPMNRLLNGDVGAGKTIIAALAALNTNNNYFQTVFLAPTEVLAFQHYHNFKNLLAHKNCTISLLTNARKIIANQGNEKNTTKSTISKKLSDGSIDIAIGTHALIQKDIRFNRLALIIVDEQQRFGVAQRAHLQQYASKMNDGIKGKIPHFLTMTATPIPRTLSLTFFGNLDISILDELPKDRKKIITQIVHEKNDKETYAFIKQEIEKGRQIFVILPLIEISEKLDGVKAATTEYEYLQKEVFPEYTVALLHGRMKADEKEEVMKNFKNKKSDILVATSVIEVGVDIPNASVILIESADRFGLSQLHQFRGRVGRGQHQSYCFLKTSKNKNPDTPRLKAMIDAKDGFEIAQKDLEIRGPGELFGSQQSGMPDIAMENLTNMRLIKITHDVAIKLLSTDPELKKYPLLKEALKKFNEKIHLE